MTSPKLPKLKPCPWCKTSKNAGLCGGSSFFNDGYFVWCEGDENSPMAHEVRGPLRQTKLGAIKAWNQRKVK